VQQTIISKNKESFVFRELNENDAKRLGNFFSMLTSDTRAKFGPHPLTPEYAEKLCSSIDTTKTIRFIVENSFEVVGYFIIDFTPFENEVNRYLSYGTNIDSKIDPVFAPCIADKYQNCGIASQVMTMIIDYAASKNIRSLVLMGGTQESNLLARAFYNKFGFVEYGTFFTEFNNVDMRLCFADTQK